MTSFDIDITRPSAARAYDYFLGGSANFEADRHFANQVLSVAPSIPAVMVLNRSFLRRVVRFCLDQGIRQFLDLGSGIPTEGNVHQIAEQIDPAARTVYVDLEPVAYNHAHRMLAGKQNATILRTDMRDVDAVLGHEDTRRLLDFAKPIGLLVLGVLLYLPDSDDPAGMIRKYRERLAPGSLVAVSTLTEEHAGAELRAEMGRLRAAYEQAGEPVFPRTHAEVIAWFDGLDPVPPGVVMLPDWHNEDAGELRNVARPLGYGGVGRVPTRAE